MQNTRIEDLMNECKRTEDDAKYTAEAHHLIAHKLTKRAFWYKFVPVIVTFLSAFALLVGAPNWVTWVTLLSAIITMLNIFMEPGREGKEHLFAAKNFTVLKHEARSVRESFKGFMSENEFYYCVRQLREKYGLLVQYTPPTDDKKAWEEARERIKRGVHEPDFS